MSVEEKPGREDYGGGRVYLVFVLFFTIGVTDMITTSNLILPKNMEEIESKFILPTTRTFIGSTMIQSAKKIERPLWSEEADTSTSTNSTNSMSTYEPSVGSSTQAPLSSDEGTVGANYTAQPFVPWKLRWNKPIPCPIEMRDSSGGWNPLWPYSQNNPTDAGLLYVKIEKAASSTLSSVAARTAIAVAERTQANNTREDGTLTHRMCQFRGMSHLWAKRAKLFSERDHGESFLWSFVKEPTERHLSFYLYFIVDWIPGENEFGEESFLRYFNETKNGYFQAKYLTKRKKTDFDWIRKANYTQKLVRQIIDDLDFIGTVERMDESLVLLSIMLDLEVTDVLYTSSKESGSYMLPQNRQNSTKCRKMGGKRPLLPEMQKFLDSPYWSDLMEIDNALYDAVDKSLDATIERVVGRDVFDAKMNEFLEAKKKLNQYCKGKIFLKCSPEGKSIRKAKRSRCYSDDIGCGHECLDELYPVVLNNDNKSIPLYLS